jgi:hypothetical protein
VVSVGAASLDFPFDRFRPDFRPAEGSPVEAEGSSALPVPAVESAIGSEEGGLGDGGDGSYVGDGDGGGGRIGSGVMGAGVGASGAGAGVGVGAA